MNTRPKGLHTPMAPVTERDPATVLRDQAREIAADAIEWSPPCTERELVQLRQEKVMAREANSRNARPAPLRIPGGAA